MKRYNPKEIEPKWQKIWQETGVYTANLHSKKPKYIGMSMFNYPSGAGIHVGHAMNYTISDIKARFKRQQGFESYHPVGWDSFGLPAENYAIKAGVSPQESMATIIPSYHKQYQAMGWSNDWEKEITTSTPEYYKWTQWIFVKMHQNGLAYQDSRWQWWCTKCQTVLANEQIVDGKCWRHDGADDPIVEKKEVKQWFFKITDYANELLEATDALDWTPSVKLAQKNWIGRSEGAEVTFQIKDHETPITVFTTAYDTIFGVTFMVLAPENDVLDSITTNEQKAEVDAYREKSLRKTEVQRQQEGKDKTGVFTGAYAINPVNGKEIPIWVADYVLASYGTGAIMAVPGEDERDYEFAQKFNLDIIYTTEQQEFVEYVEIKKNPKKFTLANSGKFDGLDFSQARKAILEELVSTRAGVKKVNYRMRDWSISRQRYWGAPIPVVNCPKCGPVVLAEDQLPVVLPELTDFAPSGDGRSALARATDWLKTTCPQCDGPAERETDTMDTYVCSSWYMLRYLDPHNQEQIFDRSIADNWSPVDFYNGGDHATAHLLYARFVTRFFTKIGLLTNPEPFKQMLYNGKVTASDGSVFSKSKGNGPDPLTIINQGYGADALRTYLMFAAPLELGARWDEQGVPGAHRFLSRIWNLVQEYIETSSEKKADEISEAQAKQILGLVHKAARKVTDDIDGNRYNTAIAAIMEAVNKLYLAKTTMPLAGEVWQEALEFVVMMVAPFAPHIADELWQQLGHSDSVHKDHWPKVNETFLVDDTITIVVQINGKVRAQLQMPAAATKEEVIEAARSQENVIAHIDDKEVRKEIYIPSKLLNLVVG
jgi:leucyl-tRNA synthetase